MGGKAMTDTSMKITEFICGFNSAPPAIKLSTFANLTITTHQHRISAVILRHCRLQPGSTSLSDSLSGLLDGVTADVVEERLGLVVEDWRFLLGCLVKLSLLQLLCLPAGSRRVAVFLFTRRRRCGREGGQSW